MRRIYLDVCCLNHPFDDQSQERIRLEAEAVLLILSRCESGDCLLFTSDVVEFEMRATPDPDRRERLLRSLQVAKARIPLDETVVQRGQVLQSFGLQLLDSLHVASAEQGQVDVFLTVDDRLLRQVGRAATVSVTVDNPVSWLMGQPREEP